MRAISVAIVLAAACGGGGDDSTSVGGSSDGGPTCLQPNDEAVGPSVEITIVNGTLGVIWLESDMFGGPGFTLADPGNAQLPHSPDPCLPSCDDVDANPQAVCLDCDPDASPELVRLEVDGRWTSTWVGGAWNSDDVACVEADCGDAVRADGCTVLEAVLPGTFTVTAEAHEAATGCVNPACDCTPDADGACLVAGTPVDPSIQKFAQLDVPNQTALELVVQ